MAEDQTKITQADVMVTAVREGGEQSAALLASIFEAQAASREALAPTWEELRRNGQAEYERGYFDGIAYAAELATQRLRSMLFPDKIYKEK